MSNQNRFLLPHGSTPASTSSSSSTNSSNNKNDSQAYSDNPYDNDQENNQHSVDTDFDSYWEEEARNPHRNRIRIGRQYQATVPPLLKPGEKDQRKLEDLETLSFCPKKSAKVSDAELDHYFTVAKSLNLFASLVETRSLLGRDVTIADLNHIRHKEGLSLASVIQPVRQAASYNSNSNVSPLHANQNTNNSSAFGQQSPQKSPNNSCDRPSPSSSSPPKEQQAIDLGAFNQPLMKALSHFISLHHPCHHNTDCKKLLKDIPLEDDAGPTVSITAGNLRQSGASNSLKETKPGRSRSSLKQAAASLANQIKSDEADNKDQEDPGKSDNAQSPTFEDWTREEVEMFSKAIEVCGKNFSSIKKDFLPSKSVKSIVEYYYIGSRDVSESKKKASQSVETGDGCSSPEKSSANNNSSQGGGGGSLGSGKGGNNTSSLAGISATTTSTSSSRTTTTSSSDQNNSNKTLSESNEDIKQTINEDSAIKITSTSTKGSTFQESECAMAKNIDARMSVYNFDEELKDDSPIQYECPQPGAEVKPLKAKPIIPNPSTDSQATNSNVGSLKFFMDGQLVLKLNACQEQQEGIEKCHWVQSGDKVVAAGRQKKYSKRSSDKGSELNQNGSQSNSVVSSYQDDDSKQDDMSADEDSKESMNSCINLPQQPTQQPAQQQRQAPLQLQPKSLQNSPTQKKNKIKGEPATNLVQSPSPVNYNRMAVNNRMKERNDNLSGANPVINQTMPWFQANSLAVAAALLGGLPFPPATGNMIDSSLQNNTSNMNPMATKPMDLSVEHGSPKAIQKTTSRSRSRPKNN